MKTCPDCGARLSDKDTVCPLCATEPEDRTKLMIGKKLAGKYLIEEHLGSGGMCDVYQATHIAMGKKVAVKLLKPELAVDAKIARRFEQEAQAASRIHHPNAINVIDYGESESHVPFIVMEYVKGITLGELIRRHGALSVERAANILRQACAALDAAHAVGVIHRDVKPDNIIIADYDGADWVEVVDFGVAKIQEDLNRRAALTGANIIVGTPRYMSPEQCEEKEVDARSDIYSLGVVLYEMLAGEAPFQGDSSTRLLVAHASEPPAPLRSKRPDISPEVEAVVMRALEKDPDRRPQTAGELARGFESAAGIAQPAQAGTARGGAFSRISVPIGQQESALSQEANDATPPDDEATLVRRRPVRTTVPVTNTPAHDRIDTPYDQAALTNQNAPYGTPPGGVVYAAPYQHRSHAGWIIGTFMLLVVAGVAAYIMFGDKLFGRTPTGDGLVTALSAIADARARVDSLPQDHPLRRYLPQLSQWQGELTAYQQSNDRSPQVMERADRYRQEAEKISAQARAALSALERQNATTTNASPPSGNEPNLPGIAIPAQPKEGEQEQQPTKKEGEGETPPEKEEDLPPPPPLPKPEEQGSQNANKQRPRRPRPPANSNGQSDLMPSGI